MLIKISVVAAPAAKLLGVQYSPATAVSHMSYSAPLISYGKVLIRKPLFPSTPITTFLFFVTNVFPFIFHSLVNTFRHGTKEYAAGRKNKHKFFGDSLKYLSAFTKTHAKSNLARFIISCLVLFYKFPVQ
jgi:hypothetical protein